MFQLTSVLVPIMPLIMKYAIAMFDKNVNRIVYIQSTTQATATTKTMAPSLQEKTK